MKTLYTITAIFFIAVSTTSCTKVPLTIASIAGHYRAVDDNYFGDEICLHDNGNAKALYGSYTKNLSFSKSQYELFFNTGNTAVLSYDGLEFCFTTIESIDNPHYWNDNDGYDDNTGYEIPRYINKKFMHRYSKY